MTVRLDTSVLVDALTDRARFWTLNLDDFRDLPGLELYEPSRPARR